MELKEVFLDYGHGGSDSGAVANGVVEKSANLVTGLACASELRKYGVIVHEARTSDVSVSLAERCNKANATNAYYYVSIHHNAGGGDRGEYIHSLFGDEGKKLAEFIGEEMRVKLGQAKKVYDKQLPNAYNDYYYVIRNTKMKAVIVEVCFLDNALDVQIADTIEEQQRNGRIIAHGILKCLGVNPDTSNAPSAPSIPSTPQQVGDYQIGTYQKNVVITAKEGLNARSGRGSNFAKIGAFAYNSVVNVWFIDKASDGSLWGSCSCNGKTAFIHLGYTKPTSASVPPPKPVVKDDDPEVKRYSERATAKVVTKQGISIRNKPSTDTGKKISALAYGKTVKYDLVVISKKYVWVSWYQNGSRVYMAVKQLSNGERFANCY